MPPSRDRCGACLSDRLEPAFTKGGYTYFRCLGCGSAMILPPPDPVVVQALYGDGYYGGEGGFGYSDAYRENERFFRAKARHLLHILPVRTGRLLEIGTGLGHFIDEAARTGFSVEGIEMNPLSAAECRERFGHNVSCGSLESLPPDGGPYDVVVLLDVLEHIPGIDGAMGKIAQLLSPGGTLLLRTPDFSSHRARREREGWYEVKPPEHLFLPSRRGIEMLLSRHGFRIVRTAATGGSGLCAGAPEGWRPRLAKAASRSPLVLGLLRIAASQVARLRGNRDTMIVVARRVP